MTAEQTRIERRLPPRTEERRQTQPLSMPDDERTRIKPTTRREAPQQAERVALIAHSLRRAEAAVLLEGLSGSVRGAAAAFLDAFSRQSSAERQGRLAAEFGIRPEASGGLRETWAAAGPELRREIYMLLPPYHRTIFPHYVPPEPPEEGSCAPCLRQFAERLVREATR